MVSNRLLVVFHFSESIYEQVADKSIIYFHENYDKNVYRLHTFYMVLFTLDLWHTQGCVCNIYSC